MFEYLEEKCDGYTTVNLFIDEVNNRIIVGHSEGEKMGEYYTFFPWEKEESKKMYDNLVASIW